jgi:hypothetical protein
MRLLGAELIKLGRPLTWGVAAAAAVFCVLLAVGGAHNAALEGTTPAGHLPSCTELGIPPGPQCTSAGARERARVAQASAQPAQVAAQLNPLAAGAEAAGLMASLPGALALALLAGAHIGGEWSGRTMKILLIQQGHRWRVLAAKLVSLWLAGVGLIAVCWLALAAAGPVLLHIDHLPAAPEPAARALGLAGSQARIAGWGGRVPAGSGLAPGAGQAPAGRELPAGGQTPAGGPGQAEVLATVERLAREALTELNHLLGALRRERAGEPARRPSPTLAELGTLLDTARAGGVPAELAVEGCPRALSPGVELSCYRIIDEALTNVARHAPGAPARVVLRYRPGGLDIEVANGPSPGGPRPAAPRPASGGRGVRGMRERAELYGGRLDAGPYPGGGFAVTAAIPCPQSTVPEPA